MANNQFINLEELSKTTQALLSKINEQSNLKVNKANVKSELNEGTKIGSIEGIEFYSPKINTSNFITQDDLTDVAYTGSYNDLSDTPTLALVATSGNYNDLSNKPKISDLTNDSQFITNNIWIGMCYNEANVLVKSVTCNGFSLKSNQLILITFQKGFKYKELAGNTWMLNINNIGAKSIANSQLLNCSPQSTLIFTYRNEEYVCLGNITITKTSELTNDSDYQNSTQVNQAIATAIGNINQFEVAIVTNLPTTNIDIHTIYFKSNSSSGNNIYDEYMYINNNWELIGSTQIDLTPYALSANLATVATSGSYNDLSNTPNLATVATSGDYDDLTDAPIAETDANIETMLDSFNLDYTSNTLSPNMWQGGSY